MAVPTGFVRRAKFAKFAKFSRYHVSHVVGVAGPRSKKETFKENPRNAVSLPSYCFLLFTFGLYRAHRRFRDGWKAPRGGRASRGSESPRGGG